MGADEGAGAGRSGMVAEGDGSGALAGGTGEGGWSRVCATGDGGEVREPGRAGEARFGAASGAGFGLSRMAGGVAVVVLSGRADCSGVGTVERVGVGDGRCLSGGMSAAGIGISGWAWVGFVGGGFTASVWSRGAGESAGVALSACPSAGWRRASKRWSCGDSGARDGGRPVSGTRGSRSKELSNSRTPGVSSSAKMGMARGLIPRAVPRERAAMFERKSLMPPPIGGTCAGEPGAW